MEQATAAQLGATQAMSGGGHGYVGVRLEAGPKGQVVVAAVATDSPAALAGLRTGDVLARAAGQAVGGVEAWRRRLHAGAPGDYLVLTGERDGKPFDVRIAIATASRPLRAGQPRAALGIQVEKAEHEPGVVIRRVEAGSAAERAHLKAGEILTSLDGLRLDEPAQLQAALGKKQPNQVAVLGLFLADKEVELKVPLDAEAVPDDRRQAAGRPAGPGPRTNGPAGPGQRGMGGGYQFSGNRYWRRATFRLAVVIIEYPDVKHNPKITARAWEDALFSRGTYKTSATGQTAYGSLADYYHEQSFGKLKVVGKAFAPVEVSKKRAEYGQGSGRGERTALLTEALDKILARDGKTALQGFDGVVFLYAGGRMSVARGSLYWPHRSSVSHQGKRWPYYICPEGGERMANNSVFCHEFGHMLGLPDLYARPENPGSEGLGIWCAMSNQAPNGRPQHFCAWSKEKLGWIEPKTIDPTLPQKLILAPIEDSPRECFKVLVRADGSEYLLLENRRKKGFDASLPAEGLLIWRVVGDRPILEEAHGVVGPAGPRLFPASVPYPSAANNAFTPYTTPSSRSQLGGGLPIHLTNIHRLPDGRIAFEIGVEYY